MKITEKQINMIAYQMMQNGIKGDAHSFTRLRDNLESGTASDVIESFMQGRPEDAVRQLEHLNAI